MENRSPARLHRQYADEMPNPPALITLKKWSSQYGWAEKVAQHDANVARRLVARTETAMTNAEFDRVAALMKVARKCLDAAAAIDVPAHGATAQDVKALASAGIDCIKLSEVLTGGVSDRQDSGAMAREARDLLRVLQDRARRGEFRPPVIDLVAIADDRDSARRPRRS